MAAARQYGDLRDGGKTVAALRQTVRVLMTVSTTHRPATDLGFLLHKHPDRVQEFNQSFGVVTVFYPEATEERCTAALMLEIDPVRLARSRAKNAPDFSLAQYVNDRSVRRIVAAGCGDGGCFQYGSERAMPGQPGAG